MNYTYDIETYKNGLGFQYLIGVSIETITELKKKGYHIVIVRSYK